jgi:peptide/nickel transport system permease protein
MKRFTGKIGLRQLRTLVVVLAIRLLARGLASRSSRIARSVRGRISRLHPLEIVSLGMFVALTIFMALAPLLLSRGPLTIVGAPLRPPSASALLGTDDQGRDLLTRTIYGMRVTWFATFPVIASGLVIGGLIGGIAGLSRGWIDNALMRFTDVVLALPGILIVIAIATALGGGLFRTLIAISVVFWTPYARIMRGEVQRIAARPHVEAARMGGTRRMRLVVVHMLPGLAGPMLVQATLDVPSVVITLAALSFLGLGQLPPAPELGLMTALGSSYVFSAWWVPAVPAAGVFVLSLLGNLAGDAVVDLAHG